MKQLFIISILALLLVTTVSGQVKMAADTMKDYTPDPTSTNSNCMIYQVKMLNAVTQSEDVTQQQLYLNSANAYEQLSKLGVEC